VGRNTLFKIKIHSGMEQRHVNDREKLEAKKDQQYLQVVAKKYNPGSLIRILRKRAISLKRISVLPNILSFITALYAVYYVAQQYAGFKFAMLMLLGAIILAGIELGKRGSAIFAAEGSYNPSERWKRWLFAPLFILVGISMIVSFYGGDNFVKEENSGPKVVYNKQRDSLQQLIVTAQAEKELMKQQTWKGVITRDARKNISNLNTRIDNLITRKMEYEDKDENKNGTLAEKHLAKMQSLGLAFGGLAVFMDALLIALLFWAEKVEWDAYLIGLETSGKASGRTDNKKRPDVSKRPKRTDIVKTDRQPERTEIRAFTSRTDATDTRTGAEIVGTVKRSCKNCGTDISHKRSDAKFCQSSCRKRYHELKA
jgi:hypothetical protein